MSESPGSRPAAFSFTSDELRAAVRLLDPTAELPAEFYSRAASAPPDSPQLLPPRVLVALTVVSERIGRAADAWLAARADEEAVRERSAFERERELLQRVARGETPPPGLGA